MNAAEADLAFPVIGMTAKGKRMFGARDFRAFTRMGGADLRPWHWEWAGGEVIDANWRRFRIKAAYKVRRDRPGLLWFIAKLYTNPEYIVDYDLEPLPPTSLAEVQTRLIGFTRKHPYHWCEDTDRESIARSIKSIKAATDTRTLGAHLYTSPFDYDFSRAA